MENLELPQAERPSPKSRTRMLRERHGIRGHRRSRTGRGEGGWGSGVGGFWGWFALFESACGSCAVLVQGLGG